MNHIHTNVVHTEKYIYCGGDALKRQLTFITSVMICSILIMIGMHFFKSSEKDTEETSGSPIAEKNLLSPIHISKFQKEHAQTKPSKQSSQTSTGQTGSAEPLKTPADSPLETKIYSYLQGPKSWESRRTWSGKWGVTFYHGAKFGAFGCGLCCLANLYSSLTPYQCTPIDAYYYSKKHTGYAGGGAIDWGYMKTSLSNMGFSCTLSKKPDSYKKFQEMIAADQGTITLVSSNDSTCYWTDTPGHYVTIFLYNKTSDKVFLADSGVPEHNRQWVSLKLIYRSLKTQSTWQCLRVTGYEEAKDTWKHKTAKGSWVRPVEE